jgi:hypothetical protein
MAALIVLLLNLVASLFKPKSQLEAENAALRQQVIVLQRKVRGRVQFTNSDRLFFIREIGFYAPYAVPRYPITGIVGCCACPASGHAAAVLPRSAMSPRRFTR